MDEIGRPEEWSGFKELKQSYSGDPELKIAIIDSRVDFQHPSLSGACLKEVTPAWLRSKLSPIGADHGTHIASVLFGQPDSLVSGIIPGASGIVIPIYLENQQGELGPCSQLDLARAISLALTEGADVVNISGGELIKADQIDPYLVRAIADCERQNVLVVAATGNDGCECLHAPATLETVLAVGAAGADGAPLRFSNWHPSFESHGVLAPGHSIKGAVPGNGVAAKSGTSFACPIVTGAAALLLGLLKKGRKEGSNAKVVREAIVATAIPCRSDTEADCDRMLAGRLNLPGAYASLFGGATMAQAKSPANRSPPNWHAGPDPSRVRNAPLSDIHLPREGNIMTSEVTSARTDVRSEPGRGVAPQTSDTSDAQVHAPSTGLVSTAEARAEGGVNPSCGGGCTCRGADPSAAPEPMATTIPSASQPQPMAVRSSHYAQPVPTPATRTATMLAGNGIAPSGRAGISPSDGGGRRPMPTDFITAGNSQLVYCIGEIGYDFITDARRDYYVQQIRAMSEDTDYISEFTETLGLEPGPIYLPEDNRAMAAFMYQGFASDVSKNIVPPGPEEIGGVVWVLFQEGQPLYALRPLHTLALAVLANFANFLFDQSRLIEVEGKPNPARADRLSIAGRIIDDITLYNGQTVPLVDVSLRGLFNWRLDLIIEDVLGANPDPDVRTRLENFLERIYYEVRNLGQTPQDRAINYLATNAFQAKEAFVNAAKEGLELDSIYAEPSPICRPKSDCYDTIMRFFDPKERLNRALDEYRLTVDVNDVVPVGIGKLRKWARFA